MFHRRLRSLAALSRLVLPFAAFSLLRRVVALETLVRLAWQPPRQPRDASADALLARRIARLSEWCGGKDDCLPRSLVLYRELSKRGADPALVIGFRAADRLLGHAWVTVDGRPVNEAEDVRSTMTPVCAFGPGGRRLPAVTH